MIAVINKEIEVVNLVELNSPRDRLSDAGRTALGTYRKDSITVKKNWDLYCSKITFEKYKEIDDYLLSINEGETYFWLDEFGGNPETDSIKAYIEVDDDQRVTFGSGGQWHSKGRDLRLKVIQK